ncbi:MAG TPA: hypothetical protein VKI99_05840 [Candidatus Dormibacteraeota bacterium]|nr:hypothetical protein [Candidatus Dormibacteraeota bacterium]
MRDHDQDESAKDLLDLTITFWQPRDERELTEEDARQIVENLVGFLRTLVRWRTATAPTIAFEDEREAA